MAQQVVIAGALFNDVPSISVPDSNSVYHPFVDPSVTTAAASDVAQGKQFIAADGTLTQGTASGGGGSTTFKLGAIRSDATLVSTWTYDKLLVQDESITIPAYSTSVTTLRQASTQTTDTLDFGNYDYILCGRSLVTPIYSSNTTGKGREICQASTCVSEPTTSKPTFDGNTASSRSNTIQNSSSSRYVYWTSGTAMSNASSLNGVYASLASAPTLGSNDKITFYIPSVNIKGSSSYLTQTYWNLLTDIRFQYIFELYKVSRTSANIYGFGVTSQLQHAFECADSASGTLT